MQHVEADLQVACSRPKGCWSWLPLCAAICVKEGQADWQRQGAEAHGSTAGTSSDQGGAGLV